MNRIVFDCEAITPIFSTGANTKKAEIRPTEIKALMRFWWRAMNPHLTLDGTKLLKEEEGEIFGSSAEGVGKSKFAVRVDNCEEYLDYTKKLNFHPKSKGNRTPALPCFAAGTRFRIILSGKGELTTAQNLLTISLILGGIGKRSRRGYGSIKITSIDGKAPVNNPMEQIMALVPLFMPDVNIVSDSVLEFWQSGSEANYPFIHRIEVGSNSGPDEDLIQKTMNLAHHYDCYHTGFAEKFPIDKKRDGDVKTISKRFASPVYISVLQNQNGSYSPIITRLNVAFEPYISMFVGSGSSFEFQRKVFEKSEQQITKSTDQSDIFIRGVLS